MLEVPVDINFFLIDTMTWKSAAKVLPNVSVVPIPEPKIIAFYSRFLREGKSSHGDLESREA